jgi:hypothetical protein
MQRHPVTNGARAAHLLQSRLGHEPTDGRRTLIFAPAQVPVGITASHRRQASGSASTCEHAGGWSVDASVTIPGLDRHGLERLVRYCARR